MTRKGANPFNCGDSRSLYVWPRLPLFSSIQSNHRNIFREKSNLMKTAAAL